MQFNLLKIYNNGIYIMMMIMMMMIMMNYLMTHQIGFGAHRSPTN